ncbi:MAG: saccharopine dehydrogenase family protein [Anaerolineales bacterium]|jgi:lysine 6-dehydrogenase
MRALVLGGAGAVCRHTTRDLSDFSDFDEIIVADYNLESAQALINEIGDSRLSAVKFDAGKYESMLKLFPGNDVIINGLPWKYDMPVTRACIEVGVNGLDVSTEKDQWDYDVAAKEKDILFIPGVGATPGITNVMARSAADQMEQVEEVRIFFAAFRSPAPAPGLLITFLWEFHPDTKERTYYRDGEFIWVRPFAGLELVSFPGQIGEQEVCYIPHPETRTMPKTLGAKAVSVKGCFPPHAMRLAKSMLESGLYSEEPIRVKGIETTAFEMMHEILLALPETKQTPLWAYGLVVDVIGIRKGEKITIRHWSEHPPMEEWGGKAAYYKNIAIPLSIGAQMIACGDIREKGVLAPESVLEPGIFFAELEKRGIRVDQEILQ